MRIILIALVAALALGVTSIGTAPAQARSTCSDVGYINAGIKVAKKQVTSLKLAQKYRYSAALTPARTALVIARNSPTPCDEDGDNFWLHREYSIKHSVALVRWLEESRDGDTSRADIYWASVEFWSDEMRDITLSW